MKETLTFGLLILANMAWGQVSDVPFKKANTILIECESKSDSVFVTWGRHLAQNGYTIEKSDNNFYTISTGPKDPSRFNVDFITNSFIDANGTIKIKIKWRVKSSMLVGTNSTDYYDWEYSQSRGNIQNAIHEDFIKVAKSLGNYQLKYARD